MYRDLFIILPVIAFLAITWCIGILIDNKFVLYFFENSHYVFQTGNGLRGLVLIKASVGKDTTCKITLTNNYTRFVKHYWTLNGKRKRFFIVFIPSQYVEVDVYGENTNDFVVECMSFNRK